MGIFDIFKSNDNSTEKQNKPWVALTEESQLEEILEKSKTKTQAIFKHSTRCGISNMVIREFESKFPNTEDADAYYLDLLNYRPISLAIANKFEVEHQSPQLIVVKNGVVTHHASHHDISAENVT